MPCEKCGGSGWIIVERDGVSGAERCDCGPLDAPPDLEAQSNLPPLYRDASFDNFSLLPDNPIVNRALTQAFLKVKGYVNEFPYGPKPGLFLMGDPGTGKSHLAAAALRALIAKGFEGVFFNYMNLLERIRAGYDPDAGSSDREAYSVCLDVPVLLIDDLGSHRTLDWIVDTVTGIVTHRCDNKKALIVTTNLLDADAGDTIVQRVAGEVHPTYRTTLGERIGERARSRLFEMCELVRITGVPDYRLRKPR
jgi:DNA replication protein DnaC